MVCPSNNHLPQEEDVFVKKVPSAQKPDKQPPDFFFGRFLGALQKRYGSQKTNFTLGKVISYKKITCFFHVMLLDNHILASDKTSMKKNLVSLGNRKLLLRQLP